MPSSSSTFRILALRTLLVLFALLATVIRPSPVDGKTNEVEIDWSVNSRLWVLPF
jgi:hypothetical protein